MHQRHRTIATLLATAALLSACGERTPEPGAVAAPTATTQAATVDGATLRERADLAMREQRLFAPAGDSAIDHYLALRAQQPDDPLIQSAMADLQPLLVISVEQAIARGALPEGRRLVGLLGRVDANAPALGRLQATVADAERLAQASALATDADSRAKVEAEAAALRHRAQGEADAAAERLRKQTVERAASLPAPVAAPGNPAPVPVRPVADAVATQRPAVPPAPQPEPVAPTPRPATVAAPPTGGSPRLVRDVAPQYPASAVSRRLAGQVQVAFTIADDGSVQSPRVVSSTLPNAFERAALTAASRWKFAPGSSVQESQRTVQFTPPGG